MKYLLDEKEFQEMKREDFCAGYEAGKIQKMASFFDDVLGTPCPSDDPKTIKSLYDAKVAELVLKAKKYDEICSEIERSFD